MKTESKPASSARRENCSNSVGPNCSADALYPSLSTVRLRLHGPRGPRGHNSADRELRATVRPRIGPRRMMTHSCWRARNETRRYIAPSDVGGDPATVRLFAQATETTGYNRLMLACCSLAVARPALAPRHWPTRRCG